jgi:hypothetical protein
VAQASVKARYALTSAAFSAQPRSSGNTATARLRGRSATATEPGLRDIADRHVIAGATMILAAMILAAMVLAAMTLPR